MNSEVWVLGATGRTGRAIASRLHEAGVPLVLVGRDPTRLDGIVAELGGTPRLLAGTLASTLAELAREAPAVVVNTVGPFTTTATQVTRAYPPGTHYVDIANELPAVGSVLALDQRAAAAHQVFRLLGRTSAHTPGALFGPALAEAAGGDFLVGEFLAEEHRGSPALDRDAPHEHVSNGNVPHESAERDVAMLTPQ